MNLFKKDNKNLNVQNETNDKVNNMKKHAFQFVLIFIVFIALLIFSNFSKSTDDKTSFAEKLINNKQFQDMYNKYVDESMTFPSENTTDYNENPVEHYDETIVYNETECIITDFFNDTTVLVTIDGKELMVNLLGTSMFEYNNKLQTHKDFLDLIVGQKATIVFDDAEDTKNNEGIVDAYIILANGNNLNQMLIKNGFVSIDADNQSYDLFNDFLNMAKYAKDNNLGYWS